MGQCQDSSLPVPALSLRLLVSLVLSTHAEGSSSCDTEMSLIQMQKQEDTRKLGEWWWPWPI